MKTRLFAFLLLASLAGLVWSVSDAQAGPQGEVHAVAKAFAEGLTAADSTKTQAVCTTQLWARCAPAFNGSPAAGSLGTFRVAQVGYEVNVQGYATALLLCRHPDGVEDVVRITVKKEGNAWKVCGGPSAATTSTPLR
ncbi:MAG TPA: hypothetical protein DEA08_29455 [Planctomycetes bacterium]|mgnify:CR=1 FL=1|nr:hypothetical protein [Planctomycetota bacterium]|tara:strand:- start:36 stop:449 length:414 start_codon:yes stop_codon:yes gene_type:complete